VEVFPFSRANVMENMMERKGKKRKESSSIEEISPPAAAQ
jgi:hypothetical protein